MTDITSQFTFADSPRSDYRRMFASIIRGMSALTDAQARIARIEVLQAKSDEELARMGLSRDAIARHVFRDLYRL